MKCKVNVYGTFKRFRPFAKFGAEAQSYSKWTDKKSICSKELIQHSILSLSCLLMKNKLLFMFCYHMVYINTPLQTDSFNFGHSKISLF